MSTWLWASNIAHAPTQLSLTRIPNYHSRTYPIITHAPTQLSLTHLPNYRPRTSPIIAHAPSQLSLTHLLALHLLLREHVADGDGHEAERERRRVEDARRRRDLRAAGGVAPRAVHAEDGRLGRDEEPDEDAAEAEEAPHADSCAMRGSRKTRRGGTRRAGNRPVSRPNCLVWESAPDPPLTQIWNHPNPTLDRYLTQHWICLKPSPGTTPDPTLKPTPDPTLEPTLTQPWNPSLTQPLNQPWPNPETHPWPNPRTTPDPTLKPTPDPTLEPPLTQP